jgi:hypothetical protein
MTLRGQDRYRRQAKQQVNTYCIGPDTKNQILGLEFRVSLPVGPK